MVGHAAAPTPRFGTRGASRRQLLAGLATLPLFTAIAHAQRAYRRTVMAASLAIYSPAGAPEDRIARLGEAFRRVMDTAGMRATLGNSGTSVRLMAPAEVGAFNTAERERYREVLALAGLAPE